MALAGNIFSTARGLRCQFAGSANTIDVISVSYSRSIDGGVDITSMGGSVVSDPNNTNNKFIYKYVDPVVIGEGELTLEFFGPSIIDSWLGRSGTLSFTQTGANPPVINISGTAYVQSVSTSVVTGDLVRGTITFRL